LKTLLHSLTNHTHELMVAYISQLYNYLKYLFNTMTTGSSQNEKQAYCRNIHKKEEM